jgi:hypothetical protein
MKMNFLLQAALSAALRASAQESETAFAKPDYEAIESNIGNDRSEFYYPKLWERYQRGDSTMTMEEIRHLLYGYVFQKEYAPYATADNARLIEALAAKNDPTAQEREEMLALLDGALKTEPFNLRYLIYEGFANNGLNRQVEAARCMEKISIVLGALFSTGDGRSKETAMHMIAVSQEYDILFTNKLSRQSQRLVEDRYDVLTLQPNRSGVDELWFDIGRPMQFLKNLFSK